MGKRKLILLLFSVAGFYLLARGGILPLLDGFPESLDYLLEPLRLGTGFDIAVGVVSLILLAWVFLLGDEGQSISRTQLLAGVAFGSAAMGALITFVMLYATTSGAHPQFPAILTLVTLLHGGIGAGAGLLMLARRESRRASPLPIAANTIVLGMAAALLCGPRFL